MSKENTIELSEQLHRATVVERNTYLQLGLSLIDAVEEQNEAEIARISRIFRTFGNQTTEPKWYHRNEGL